MTLLEWNDFVMDQAKIYRAMGSNPSRGINQFFADMIEETRPRAMELIKVRTVSAIVPVTGLEEGRVILDGRLEFDAPVKFFKGATHALVMVATVGSGLEAAVVELSNAGQMLEALTLGAFGSVALEEVQGLFRGEMDKILGSKKQCLGYSLSPGCSAIPLENQRAVFGLVDGEKIGVSLSDSNIMSPVKSISMLIPVGEGIEPLAPSAYACQICEHSAVCNFHPPVAEDGFVHTTGH